MDERHRAMLVFFLLCFIGDMPAEGHSLDVCATCHANATCDDKSDGSGKVCNCKYGFVGNGRTFCQDKDECQIGDSKICGPHTTCHNTYGSYYCKCLSGYSPSNNMDVFIPNDGTHCQDVDECRMTGLCGEGGQCRNLEGTVDCSCRLGYQVYNGAEPFHPYEDTASCKVVDCGQRTSVDDTVLLSVTGTTYGSVAMFVCDEGLVWRSGDNSSVCGADGLWRGADMVCEEVDCGSPPALPHSLMLWNKSSRMGTEVLYQCNSGYHNVGKGNVSICTPAGQWEKPSVLCQGTPIYSFFFFLSLHFNFLSRVNRKGIINLNPGVHVTWLWFMLFPVETLCGSPPIIESTEQVWDSNSTPGSTVLYVCKKGFYNKGGHNVSICNEDGQWTPTTLFCREILCGDPPILPHTGQVWNGSSTAGSTLTYYCKIGFYHNEGSNMSLCTINGYWTKPNISCKEVDCGEPPPIPHSVILWGNISTVGSQVVYQCNSGYGRVGEGNVSVCTASGEWDGASLLCQEINCQEPVFKPHAKMLWDGTSHIGSVVQYQCEEGYYTGSLRNYSVCGENGLWEDIDLCCEEVSCGPPLTLPHTNLRWDGTSRPGSVVLYECTEGFYQERETNISTCLLSGQWGEVSVKCKAKCGPVPFLANSEVMWHNRSMVIHRCVDGYHSWRGSNVSVCGSSGVWQTATLRCIEVSCGPPLTLPHTNLRWDGTSRPGSVVLYECTEGFYQERETNISTCLLSGQWGEVSVKCKAKCGPVPFLANSEVMWHNRSMVIHRCVDGYHSWRGSNVSVCGSSGVWQTATLRCIEVSCGPPLTLPHTNLRWDGTSRPGSVVLYECTEGFYQERETNISTCLLSGQWGEVSVKCKAKCGPVPFLANSEVIWHNRSMVIHRCVDGYHSWRGSNVSVCGSSGVWQTATLRCIEIKPPVSHLVVLNEKCLHWRAEKHEEDTEVYKVTYIGSRDYQSSFHDTRKQFLSSKADQLELCLNLLPVTNYSISIIAVSSRFTITITTNTSLPVPPAPVVYYREFETPVPTLRLRRSPNTLDPISLYQVFVLPVEGIMMFDCSSPASSGPSSEIKSSTEYITAQIDVRHVGTEMNFTVGDGLDYGGFFNAPLENGRNYYIILRAVSQWKSALKSSCVLWAKVRDTSYVLRVSSLVAAASIGLVALVILGRYSFTWYGGWYNTVYYTPC
ncbi:sushi, von Willebrand factor type A, EGF and pentraxin domain-containing protein 1 isoform X10 [Sebastes fasciatus]|uniref:sushi, von Willebrand factor type A, EGF and pentraxin domain-containing protein 1 isoform X10 n=1 Tax=Sebastes fasciatus TaxID=394691 RepID=UPI003D9DE4B7